MLLVDQVPTRLIPDAIKSGIIYKKIEVVKASIFVFLRKVGDSNPRYACAYTAFRVRLFRPLRQLSSNSSAKVVLFS